MRNPDTGEITIRFRNGYFVELTLSSTDENEQNSLLTLKIFNPNGKPSNDFPDPEHDVHTNEIIIQPENLGNYLNAVARRDRPAN